MFIKELNFLRVKKVVKLYFAKRNEVYKFIPKAPVRFYYSLANELVPMDKPKTVTAEMHQPGFNSIEYVDVGSYSHEVAWFPATIQTKLWFDSLRAK